MYSFLKGRLTLVRLTMLVATLALIAIGIGVIHAVGNPVEPRAGGQNADLAGLWKKQLIFAALGSLAFLAVNTINYRRFGAVSAWIYAGALLLLALLLFDKIVDIPFVPVRKGARRWIGIAIAGRAVNLQPSEFCKLAYILALAWYLRYRSNYRNFRAVIGPFVLTLLPMLLILAEPDLGTVLLMMPVLFTMLFVAGARAKHLLMVLLLAVLVSPLLWYSMNHYQRIRISSVLLQNSWVQRKAEQHPTLGRILVGNGKATGDTTLCARSLRLLPAGQAATASEKDHLSSTTFCPKDTTILYSPSSPTSGASSAVWHCWCFT